MEPTLFADVDDAVRIADDSIYGLSGGIMSGTEERALDLAHRIRTGTLAVNGGLRFGPDAPFGGYKPPRDLSLAIYRNPTLSDLPPSTLVSPILYEASRPKASAGRLRR